MCYYGGKNVLEKEHMLRKIQAKHEREGKLVTRACKKRSRCRRVYCAGSHRVSVYHEQVGL